MFLACSLAFVTSYMNFGAIYVMLYVYFLKTGINFGKKVRRPCFSGHLPDFPKNMPVFLRISYFHTVKTLSIASKLDLTLSLIIWYCFILVLVGISPIFRRHAVIPPNNLLLTSRILLLTIYCMSSAYNYAGTKVLRLVDWLPFHTMI